MEEENEINYDDLFSSIKQIKAESTKPKGYTGMGNLASQMVSTYRGQNTGFGKSKYDEGMNWDVSVDEDNISSSINEYRAQNQSWGAKAGLGLGRVANKAVSEIAKIPGYIGGAVAAIGAEENQGMDTFVNNSWIKTVNSLSEDLNEEYLPVYVKKAVSEGDLWDNISSVDFWATDGADGIGFIASMLVPGAALKALGVGSKLAKLPGLAGRMSAQTGDVVTATLANTMVESAAEAQGAISNFEKSKPEFILKLTNEGYSLKDAELAYQEQKGNLGRDVFVSNMAILALPNALQANMLWGKGVNKTVSKIIGEDGKLLSTVIEPKLYQKLANRGKNVLGATASEGFFEEAGQSAVENMFTSSANKNQLTSNYLKDFNLSELGDAYLDTVTSTEGQKAIFLGAFLGGGMSAVSGAKQDISDRKATQSLLDIGNNSIDSFYKIFQKDIYNEDGTPNSKSIKDKFEGFGQIEQLNNLYNEAIEKQDKDTLEKLRDLAATQLAYGFIRNDDLGLDVLKEHLNQSSQFDEIVQREQEAGNNVTKEDIIKNVMNKATVLQKAYSNFNDFAPTLVNPELNSNQTAEDILAFRGELASNYLTNKATINLYEDELKKLNGQRSNILEDLDLDTNLVIGDETIQNQEINDSRLKQVTESIKDIKENLDNLKKLDKSFWNKKTIKSQFDKFTRENKKLITETTPEKVLTADEADIAIKNATSIDELDKIDLMNNPVLTMNYNAKKSELEQLDIEDKEATVELEEKEKELIKEKELQDNLALKDISSNNIGEVITNPIDETLSTIENKTKNSITLKNNETGNVSTYNFTEDISDNNSADDIDVGSYTSVPTGVTHHDAKTPGYDKNNISFGDYLMEVRDKVDDKVTFEFNTLNLTEDGKKAIEIVESRKGLVDNRQFLIDNLPLHFVYNNGQAKSWSAFKGMNNQILRASLVDELILGAKLEDLSTKVVYQDAPSFNVKFVNNKPIKNNPLSLEFVRSLDEKNPENKVTLYHVNAKGDLILVSNNKQPLPTNLKKSLQNEKGQIFLVIKNPREDNIPVKLNFNKLNEAKASTLARIYEEVLKDFNIRQQNLIVLNQLNPQLFTEINNILSSEITLLGGNPATFTIDRLIETLVYESSWNDKSIIFSKDNDDLSYISFDNQRFYIEDIDKLAVALQNKYHNVMTITTDENLNKNLNFKNPIYLKYLFDNGILSTNLNTEGSAFKQSTDTKATDIKKNKGAELWISSTVTNSSKPVVKTTPVNKEEVIKSKISEYNTIVNKILSKRTEGQDTITDDYYIMDDSGNFINTFEKAVYNDTGSTIDDEFVLYSTEEEIITETIENNYQNILNSQKKSVSLPNTIQNDMEVPGTQDNLDYKEAFKKLEIKGEDLIQKEKLDKTLEMATTNLAKFKDNVKLFEKFEKVVKETEQQLQQLADKLNKKC